MEGESPYAVRVRPREVETPDLERPRPSLNRGGSTYFIGAAYRRSQIAVLAPAAASTVPPPPLRPSGRVPSHGTPTGLLDSISPGSAGMSPSEGLLGGFGSPSAAAAAGTKWSWAATPTHGSGAAPGGVSATPSNSNSSLLPPPIFVATTPAPEETRESWWGSLLGVRVKVEPVDDAAEVASRAATNIQRVARGQQTRHTITRFMEDNYSGWEKLVDEPQASRAHESIRRYLSISICIFLLYAWHDHMHRLGETH